MKAKTHATIGVAAGLWTAYSLQSPPLEALLIIAAAGVGALLPDIDHPNSRISRRARPARLIFRWFRHRGLTHSLLGAGMVCFASYTLLPLEIAVAVTVAYCSHVWADMLTGRGVLLFYPLWNRPVGMPRFLTMRTGSQMESLVWMVAVLACLYLGRFVFGY